MYETYLHKSERDFANYAQAHLSESQRAGNMVGWNGAINYSLLSDDLILLYQLEKAADGWSVCDMHMLLWGSETTLRKDIGRIGKFWKADGAALWNPQGNILWHSSLIYGDRAELPFVVANAWQEEQFKRYSQGGNFEITFAGLGTWLECLNDSAVIRFYEGAPVELARREMNDPNIDHRDVDMSQLRSLNPCDSKDAPALAEFTGVVDACSTVKICGEKCYRIRLWSGSAAEAGPFPWQLLIAANHVDGKYVPRVGDIVHGNAVIFGMLHGDQCDCPTLTDERECVCDSEKTFEEPDDHSEQINVVETHDEGPHDKKDFEYLPRKPAQYPDVKDYGKGLSPKVIDVMPKFVTCVDYRKAMKGTLEELKNPTRKDLRRIFGEIEYVITSKKNRHMFSSVVESSGIRHFVRDTETEERHLWCCIPSGFGQQHFHTNLWIAISPAGNVLRYTLYSGEWERWHRLNKGIDLTINFQSEKRKARFDKMPELIDAIEKMKEDDYLIAVENGHTVMVQAYCNSAEAGVQDFRVEWQLHYLPWQFFAEEVSAEKLVEILKTFDAEGLESVETMLDWQWCKMRGNV